MSKFDWGTFFGSMAQGIGKTGPEMYKDIRAQNIAQAHYADTSDLARQKLALEADTAAYTQGYNQGYKGAVPVEPYQPGGIGGPTAATQIRSLGPGSLNAAEGSYDLLNKPTPTTVATPPTQQLPSDVPGLAGGVNVPAPAPTAAPAGAAAGSLEDVRKRLSQLDPSATRERAVLMGQQAQLEEGRDKEISATLIDLNKSIKDARDANIKEEEIKKILAQREDELARMTAHFQTRGGTPEQMDALRTKIGATEQQITMIRAALLKSPEALSVLEIDRARHARLLTSMGVDPALIEEYQLAYARGDNLQYLGRQILQQARGRQGGAKRK